MKKTLNITILIISMVLIAAPFFITIDQAGLKIAGPLWYVFRCIQFLTGNEHSAYQFAESFHHTAHGNLAKALQFSHIAPITYFFLAFQLPYRTLVLSGLRQRRLRLLKKTNFYFFSFICLTALTTCLYELAKKIITKS